MAETFFITGIGTEVGKTIASAIVTEALQADYWKPIQAGDLHDSDTHKVKNLISNEKSIFHKNAFALRTAMSPHAAAEIDGIDISANKITRPEIDNHLVIEGAGGLLVPINSKETILDLIKPEDRIIIVSRHYLGSINHTLLTAEVLKSRGFKPLGILFNGPDNPTSQEIILKMSGLPCIGNIAQEAFFDKETVSYYSRQIKASLLNF